MFKWMQGRATSKAYTNDEVMCTTPEPFQGEKNRNLPVVQRELDEFVAFWNSNRIQYKRGVLLPHAQPNHIFSFSEMHCGLEKGIPVSEEKLVEAGADAYLDEVPTYYLQVEFSNRFSALHPNPEMLEINALASLQCSGVFP